MRYYEIAPTSTPTTPATPQQARVRSLRQRVATAQAALTAERKAQALARAQASVRRALKPSVT